MPLILITIWRAIVDLLPPTLGVFLAGDNSKGQLGDETQIDKSSPIQTISGGNDWELVESGDEHSSAIKTDGTLWLWGSNSAGQLGDGTSAHKSSPVQTVAGGTDWAKVAGGVDHHAAIKTDGTLWMWGWNSDGQLGDGTIVSKSSPVQTISGGSDWVDVACSFKHTSAIKTDGTLWSWGSNQSGPLGDGTIVSKSSPVQTISGGTDWNQVTCGWRHVAAIKTDGTLWSWGEDSYGELGDNSTVNKSSPVQVVTGGTDWKQVSAYQFFTAAIKTDGTLWSWGENLDGQLGDNSTVDKSSPVQTISGGTDWDQVSCGWYHTGAVKKDGTLWLWGYDGYGELMDGTTVDKSSPVQEVTNRTDWKQVSCGRGHTVATRNLILQPPEALFTWGYNGYGQLGDETITNKSTPEQTIAGGVDWEDVSCGFFHSAVIKDDGTLWMWGHGGDGRLGDGSVVHKSSPVQTVAGGTDWKQVSCGYDYSAAIKTDGTLWLWGRNTNGQIGDETITSKSSPVQTISGGSDWAYVSTRGRFTTAIKTDGTLWTWGDNFNGQLGDNSTTAHKSSPVQTVAGGTDWVQVSAGFDYAAAIKTDGTLWTWGRNDVGQIGDNSTAHKSSPVQTVAGGTDWSQASCGYGHSGAIKTDGTLWLWGSGFRGTLGDGTIVSKSSPVQTISGGTDWEYIACGDQSTGAMKTDNTLWMWGRGSSGILGDGTTAHKSSPVQTALGGTDWIPSQIVFGYQHTLALKTYVEVIIPSYELWGWGWNAYGQLGDNTTGTKSSPVQTISGGSDWTQVSDGYSHTAAIKKDGTLWTWGQNQRGQLGDGTITTRLSPVQTVSGGTDWADVHCGVYHTVAIKTDGTLWTWGSNYLGSLGDNTIIYRSSPVQTVAGGSDWVSVSCGYYYSGAIKTDGSLWMWGGSNFGELGDNTILSRSSPVQTISGGTDWSQIVCGRAMTAAIKTDGTLWLWGVGASGALGDGTITAKSSPVQTVSGGTDWVQVDTGTQSAIAIKSDGTLWTWGDNYHGRLGDNTSGGGSHKSSPVQTVSGGTDWAQATCGARVSAAVKTDGTLWIWGYDSYGRLADGVSSVISKSSPVQTIATSTNWKSVTCSYHVLALSEPP